MRSSRIFKSFGWAVLGSTFTMVLTLVVHWGPGMKTPSACNCGVHVDSRHVNELNQVPTVSPIQSDAHEGKKMMMFEEKPSRKLERTISTNQMENSSLPLKFRPQWWKNHTREVCKALRMNTDVSLLKDGIAGNAVFDDNHKIMVCQVAKVASTYLGRIFAILTGKFNGTNPYDIPPNEIHSKYNAMNVNLNGLSFDELKYRLDNYFTFTVVRDPFERLLSAYRNKFVPKANSAFAYLSNLIIRDYRKDRTDKSGLTFPEFVEYLSDTDSKIHSNGHWMPYYKLCRPCEINYDFIGKLETLAEDLQFVAEVNNLTGLVELPKPGSRSEGHSFHKTDRYLEEYYSKVPKDLLRKLYKVYYPDYAIYNFTVPPVIKDMML